VKLTFVDAVTTELLLTEIDPVVEVGVQVDDGLVQPAIKVTSPPRAVSDEGRIP
jgi:hypothetical protein